MKYRIWVALLAVYLFWGATYLGMRFAVESIPPFLMAGTRFIVAGTILFAWRKIAGDPFPMRIHWRSAAVIGLLMLAGANANVAWAEQTVPSGIAALIISTVPLWMALIDFIWPGSVSPGWRPICGVVIGFVGVALLVIPAIDPGGTQGAASLRLDPIGIFVLLLAAILWALGSLYSRNATLPGSPLMGTAIEMLVGGTGCLVISISIGEWNKFDPLSVKSSSLLGLVYLIVFGSLVAFAAYTWLLRVAPTPLVSTYAYVNPLVAIILGSWLAHETLTPGILVATVIIVSAVALTSSTRRKKMISSNLVGSELVEDI